MQVLVHASRNRTPDAAPARYARLLFVFGMAFSYADALSFIVNVQGFRASLLLFVSRESGVPRV